MQKKTLLLRKNIFKYLILGSNGLLGSEFKKILPKKYTLTIAKKNSDININLKKFQDLNSVFKKFKFKFVINCAAITDLNSCESNYLECKKINTILPYRLGLFSRKFKFKLIQISTDQVYFSKKKFLNKETDRVKPINNYAKSKILCENSLKKINNCLIIRTNFTGFKKKLNSTFIGWVLDSIKKKKKVKLFNDMYVSTLDVSSCTKLIKKLIFKDAKGLYNVGTSYPITKKEYAIIFSKKIKKKIYFTNQSVNTLDLKRSNYLGLDIKKIENKLKTKMISPQNAISKLVNQIPN